MKILTSRNAILAFILFTLIFLGASISWALEKDKKQDPAQGSKSVHVISDKMVAQKDSSMVEFIGNVKATREDSVMFADSIKIFFHPSGTKKNGQGNVKEIVSTGNVKYIAGERKAFSDKAVYTTEDEILVLTGDMAKLLNGKNWVTGKKITLFRKEDRAMVESDGKTRVEAIFNPEDKTGNQ